MQSSGSTARWSTLSEARISPFDHGLLVGDGVFETLRVYDGVPFAWTPPLRAAGPLGRRARARRARPRAAAAGRRRGAGGERPARSPAAHHGHRRAVTGGVGAGAGAPTVIVAATSDGAVAGDGDVVTVPWTRNERSAVAGLEDDLVRRERARPRVRARARRGRGDLPEHARRAVRGHRLERVPRARRRAAHARSRIRLPARRHPRTRARARRRRERAAYEEADGARRARAPPTRCSSRSTREVQAIARVDGRELPPVPGPVTTRCARRFAELLRRDLDP